MVLPTRIQAIMLTQEQKTLASVCLYAVAALFVKLSIFCLYLRLFKVKQVTRWLIYGGMAACSIVYTASVIANCVFFVPSPGQPQVGLCVRSKCKTCTDFEPTPLSGFCKLVCKISNHRK
jgi:hypothetical protein